MEFTHHPDLTCLAQARSFEEGHHQIQRHGYTFTFTSEGSLKDACKLAIAEALAARKRRGITSGRLHVELCDDGKSGRVIDHLPLDDRGDARKFEKDATEQEKKPDPVKKETPPKVAKEPS